MIVRTIFRVLWAATVFVFAVAVALFVCCSRSARCRSATSFAPRRQTILVRQGAASVFGMVLFVGAVTPALTVLPAAIAAIVGEALRIRSWMYYVLASRAAMAAIPMLASPRTDRSRLPTGQYMTIFAAAGFVGGFVYWLLAGRNA